MPDENCLGKKHRVGVMIAHFKQKLSKHSFCPLASSWKQDSIVTDGTNFTDTLQLHMISFQGRPWVMQMKIKLSLPSCFSDWNLVSDDVTTPCKESPWATH